MPYHRHNFTRLAALSTLSLASLSCMAQAFDDKTITPVPAFQAFRQWVGTQAMPNPSTGPVVRVEALPLVVPAPARVSGTYQPAPVIVGAPDLPLLGASAQQAAQAWSASFNYQGLNARLWVLNAKGTRIELRALGTLLKPGERFKIQLTPTFPAVAAIDQVVGDIWYGKRTGQVYPTPGQSVAIQPGESITLPLGDKEFFTMNSSLKERFVLSVRHAKAKGEARSEQPVYRQDAELGSQYLQLVPKGTYPAIEQLIGASK